VIAFYLDAHIPRAITRALRGSGVDVLSAREDGMAEAADILIFKRAQSLGRVLVSEDQDFLRIVNRKIAEGVTVCGAVFFPQLGPSIGQCIEDLDLIGHAGLPGDLLNRIYHLPLR
jgi:Domain of unknown function (DUF5615)